MKNLKKIIPRNNFIKFQKLDYNKRMGIFYRDILDKEKTVDDLLKINNVTDQTDLAASIQSDMYHERLFESISKLNINSFKEEQLNKKRKKQQN
jgi:hypothetical protein